MSHVTFWTLGCRAIAAILRRGIPALALTALAAAPVAAVNVPAGFTDNVYVSGVTETNGMYWGPGGDLWIIGKTGNVWLFRNGQLQLMLALAVNTEGERGLNGIAVDPDYSTNRYIWLYYMSATPPLHNRLSRFTHVGNQLVDETVILEGPNVLGNIHNAGCLRFASDKTLFMTMGDDAQHSTFAQDPHDLRGKVLHMNRDGSPAAGNPFLDGVNGHPLVWAYGFRHPWRFNLQPGTENLFIADVGEATWEELDIGVAGGNFGWAFVEGPSPAGQPGYIYPIYWYKHDPNFIGNSIIGGDHAKAGDFSPEYLGNYFFADYNQGRMTRMILDASNNPVSTDVWATSVPGAADIQFGPGGCLYYASYTQNEIRKICYVGGTNRQPIAAGTTIPDSGNSPLRVTLDGSASSDPDGDPLTYLWDFGDGHSSNKKIVDHNYGKGVYNARLTVDDGRGGTNTTPQLRIVSGNNRPTAIVTAPVDESRYDAGQVIPYAGSGSDIEDGSEPCSRFTWTVIFHHLGHTHPYLGPIQGVCSGTFTTNERGEVSPDTFYEVKLQVEDSGQTVGSNGKLTGTQSVEIRPNISTMTFVSAPRPDLELTLDTQPFVPPKSVVGVVNFIREIGASEPQTMPDGHTYRWLSWSDGGARVHEIRTPASDTTFTATFGCNVLVEAQGLTVDKTADGSQLVLSWQPVSDACLAGGPARYRIYASVTPIPTTPPGNFPNDPAFTLVGTSGTESFTYTPAAGDEYFVVVAVGSDGFDGPAGHY